MVRQGLSKMVSNEVEASSMEGMRSLVVALLIFAGAIAIGIFWEVWPMLLSQSTTIGSNTRLEVTIDEAGG